MNKILFFLKFIFLLFLLLIIAVYFFGNAFLNTRFVRVNIKSFVNSKANYKLDLNGKTKISLYPKINFEISELKLHFYDKKIDIGKLFLEAPFDSIYNDKIVIDSIVLNDTTFSEYSAKIKNSPKDSENLNLPLINNIKVFNFRYIKDKEEIIYVNDLKASPITNIGLSKLSSNFKLKDRNIYLNFKTKSLKKIVNGRKGKIDLTIKENKKEIGITGDIEINKNSHSYSFNGKAFNGKFNGKFKLEKSLLLEISANNFSTKAIEEEFKSDRILNGLFDVDLKIKNDDFFNNPKKISGSLSVTSDNLHIDNTTLKTTTKGLYKILKPILGQETKKAECAIFNFEIKDGKFVSKEQALQVGSVFIFPDGEIDLINNNINYNFHVNSESPSLASLIPPFKALGKLNNISFYPSISGSVASVSDTAEGIVGFATNIVRSVKEVVTFSSEKKLLGVDLCKEKYELDKKMLSSRIGKLIK